MKKRWKSVFLFILATVLVIALIVWVVVTLILNHMDESVRRSILSDYANNVKLQIVSDTFHNGGIPEITKDYLTTITYQGDRVICEEGKTDGYEVLLKNCVIGNHSKKYGYIKGKIYDDCTSEEFIQNYEKK